MNQDKRILVRERWQEVWKAIDSALFQIVIANDTKELEPALMDDLKAQAADTVAKILELEVPFPTSAVYLAIHDPRDGSNGSLLGIHVDPDEVSNLIYLEVESDAPPVDEEAEVE